MAIDKAQRPWWFPGIRESVQTITVTGAASTNPASYTRIKSHGVTRIVSTGTGAVHHLGLDRPTPGQHKTIIARMNSTSEVAVVAYSSGSVFDGTTANKVTFSTGADGRTALQLVGISTSQWAIIGSGAMANTTASPTPAGYVLSASTIAVV